MIDIKNKRCRCGKASPIYNEPGETERICCSSCKTTTMINVINKKCRCGKARPVYNEPGEIKQYVVKIKTTIMINVINKDVNLIGVIHK